jgi:hypothetical protein
VLLVSDPGVNIVGKRKYVNRSVDLHFFVSVCCGLNQPAVYEWIYDTRSEFASFEGFKQNTTGSISFFSNKN